MNIIPTNIIDRLIYNHIDGTFTWRTSFFKTKIGSIAGQLRGDGYLQIEVANIAYLSHRLAWFIYYKEQPPKELDHINCIRTDNRICNLRIATRNNNQHNKRIHRNNTSGIKGVCWHKHTSRWVARIMIDKVTIGLGYHKTIEKAEQAIKEARIKYHGEYANHG